MIEEKTTQKIGYNDKIKSNKKEGTSLLLEGDRWYNDRRGASGEMLC